MALQHLLSTRDLSVKDINALLDDASSVLTPDGLHSMQSHELRGKRLVLAFFEASTRTRLSFETAADRLGASSIFFQGSGSSVEKERRCVRRSSRSSRWVLMPSSSVMPQTEFTARSLRIQRCR
ncbi:MAG: hypothetical protein IPF59_12200 [Ignavibacteria bacterium]|nr:hypothetical protein [Ignavibacteria bacterium]